MISRLKMERFCTCVCGKLFTSGMKVNQSRLGFRLSKIHTDCILQQKEKNSKQEVEKLLENSLPQESELVDDKTWATTPFPVGTVFNEVPEPKMKSNPGSVILFPGQGTQYVGMGSRLKHLPIVLDMFAAASEVLKYDLLKVCTEGPKEKLTQTKYCQPAVLVCSLAAVEQLKEKHPAAINFCSAVAGFSVGEVSALTFAGCIGFEKAVLLVKKRAEAMDECSKYDDGGMMTIFHGADFRLSEVLEGAIKHCKENGIADPVCSVANYLFPHCKIIAGHKKGLLHLQEHSNSYKIRRAVLLPVSGAFHTSLMRPAADELENVLKHITFNEPLVKVYCGSTGKLYFDAYNIRSQFCKQIYRPVRWEQVMHALFARPVGHSFPKVFECGPGTSLLPILKYVNRKAAENALLIRA